jgi:hypothetical protein
MREAQGQGVVPREHETRGHVSVPAQVWGRTVNDKVRAQVQRAPKEWRGKGAVHDEERSLLVSKPGDRRPVHEAQERVRDGFHKDRTEP